jgi:hypothetical protein
MQFRGISLFARIYLIAACVSAIICGPFLTVCGAQINSDASLQSPGKMPPQVARGAQCRILYLGIVGGLETANNPRSGVVQIRDVLRGKEYPDVCAKSFSPYVWLSGLNWVLEYFPPHPGRFTDDELERAPEIVIVGHSLGGWAAVSIARNLDLRNIPVELTVQIDSVGFTDHTVPKNVKAAAIFHARDVLMFLTTKGIKLEDPNQTRLVENVLVRNAGHESVTRDPRIRQLVLGTVESLRGGSAQTNHPSEQPRL